MAVSELAGTVKTSSRLDKQALKAGRSGLRLETAELAVCRKKRRGPVLVFASHDRHRNTNLDRILKIGPVSLPENAFHSRREIQVLELYCQMSKAIVRQYLVFMNTIMGTTLIANCIRSGISTCMHSRLCDVLVGG